VEFICDCVDELRYDPPGTSRKLIRFVEDRPGNDRRYSMDTSKLQQETPWQVTVPFEVGLMETVKWYLDNDDYYTRNIT
jgi:dTDP-glucose 4,6-dehydratase